ncbi:MAG TPA: hypothetical protein VER12_14655 [Polyangiaceae bacterium]|nr:hypothetical protein [Polyangiaceae bacterium]
MQPATAPFYRTGVDALLVPLVDAMHERTVRNFSACVVLSVLLLGSRRLHAQELGPTLLSYRAPDGCPTAADFRRSVGRRSSHVHLIDEGPHDRQLSIVIRREGEATHGELRLAEKDGRASQRNVRFTTCSEAVEGLALIAVVSLDPQALLEPTKPQEESPRASAAPPKPAAIQTPAPMKREPLPAATPREKTLVALGAAFNVAPSALPATALGGAVFVDLASSSTSWFTPLFRLALSHVERRGLSSSSGAEANFTLSLATLSVCPLRLAGGFLEFRPCAFAGGGVLNARGSQANNPQQRTRPYGALGGSGLLFAQASQAIDIVADIALGATLLRDSFGFEEDQPWQTPALYFSSGIGVRFTFR